jgi:hypothetical protein
MTQRRGRRRKQLLDDLKGNRKYCKLKEEALDRSLWRTRFGRGYGPVVRQTTEGNAISRQESVHGIEEIVSKEYRRKLSWHIFKYFTVIFRDGLRKTTPK